MTDGNDIQKAHGSSWDTTEQLEALDALSQLEQLGGPEGRNPEEEKPQVSRTASKSRTKEKSRARKKSQRKNGSDGTGVLGKILGGNVLTSEIVQKQWGLIFLIALFAMLLVGNRYHVEKLQKDKIETEERINILNEHRIQMQKQSQEQVKVSSLMKDLDSTGLGYSAGPPFEL